MKPSNIRYVIKNPNVGYFTEMKISKTVPVTLDDRIVGHQNTYRPIFEGMRPSMASLFDTEADARSLMQNERYGGASAFANCTIEPLGA